MNLISKRILVVDDEEQNRLLLRDLLEVQGYEVSEAEDGEQALQKTAEVQPDLVLLDLMMPKLDGFEVCRRLKRNPETAPIPILLVTSLNERNVRLTGIEAGANDFLNKPIDAQDLVLRVRNAIYAKTLFDELQENYDRLQELEALRDNLTHMIVHDMRTPLMAINGYLQLLKMTAGQKLEGEEKGYVDEALSGTSALVEMVSSLLDVSRLEAGAMPLNLIPSDLGTLATEAIATLGTLVRTRQVHVEVPPEPLLVRCDAEIIRRVIVNLIANAVKFTPPDGQVQVTVKKDDAKAKVAVADTGPGIPPEYREKIFEKFGQVETQQKGKYSTGLGLTFCKLAAKAHGGKIGVNSEVGKGSTFWFTLPL
ncbi:MAG TPA: response regulator [Acidobacteriota bacterium]|jgi:signal transduction histidine kinase